MALSAVEEPLRIDDGKTEPLEQEGAELDSNPGRIVAASYDRDLAEEEAERLGVVRVGKRPDPPPAHRLREHAPAEALDVLDEHGARREPHRPPAQPLDFARGECPDPR